MVKMTDSSLLDQFRNMWRLLLLQLLLAALVTVSDSAQPQIKPSLECVCQSMNRNKSAFDLDCQRVIHGSEVVSVGKNSGKNGDKYFSCAYGPGGLGEVGGDWRAGDAGPRFGMFLLGLREMSWDDARAACSERGLLLAPMTSGSAEANAALKALSLSAEQLLWIGVRYYEDVQGFYTTRGQLMGGMEWPKGQPNIRKNSNCPALGGDSRLRGPYACSGKRRFICSP